MDHVRLDLDPDMDEIYPGGCSAGVPTMTLRGIAVPIEARLRLLSVGILYEVCRVQKLSLSDLRIFDDVFIEHLFDLVEKTRTQSDETFNYSVIKLIGGQISLNEQFMVASIQPHTPADAKPVSKRPEEYNRVLRILMARMGSSMTFGENMIFMLNRAGRSPEDLVMQLLVLKILYLLFTTDGTSEFFYYNDLKVLVDVFLREITDLGEENESLRHTYLRVLHPLLNKTQLRSMPYKRQQIVRMLESLIEHENIRDINATTKRLVHRCLSGDWCAQYRKPVQMASKSDFERRVGSPGLESVTSAASMPAASSSHTLLSAALAPEPEAAKGKTLKASRSVENLKAPPARPPRKGRAAPLGAIQRSGSNDSSTSLPRVAAAEATSPTGVRRTHRVGSMDPDVPAASVHERRHRILEDTATYTQESPDIRVVSPATSSDRSGETLLSATPPLSAPASSAPRQRRSAPAPPPRRRKPPAIPTTLKSPNGVTITTIASSSQGNIAGSRKNLISQTVV
ncbi:hypothetical protein EIP86_009179 [Pleurotus ostreatoroseus]|nr:hypothetical protein EIP86_009179 [Pleurotus ostreatoroseus]